MSESRKSVPFLSDKISFLYPALSLSVYFALAALIGIIIPIIVPLSGLFYSVGITAYIFLGLVKHDLQFIRRAFDKAEDQFPTELEFPAELIELHQYEYDILNTASSFFKNIAATLDPLDTNRIPPAMLFRDNTNKPHVALIELESHEDAQLGKFVAPDSPTLVP